MSPGHLGDPVKKDISEKQRPLLKLKKGGFDKDDGKSHKF